MEKEDFPFYKIVGEEMFKECRASIYDLVFIDEGVTINLMWGVYTGFTTSKRYEGWLPFRFFYRRIRSILKEENASIILYNAYRLKKLILNKNSHTRLSSFNNLPITVKGKKVFVLKIFTRWLSK